MRVMMIMMAAVLTLAACEDTGMMGGGSNSSPTPARADDNGRAPGTGGDGSGMDTGTTP